MTEEHKYKQNAKLHLYETKHSGFYPEDPDKLVNLVPKSWTKFTVTDGTWMTDNTLTPLENRDIYLANKIDELDEYKKNYYQASSHFIIDHENKTMSVNPFDTLYNFHTGILYDNENFTIYSQTPAKYGGIENRLTATQNGLEYKLTALDPSEQETYTMESAHWFPPEFHFSATINDLSGSDMIDQYNDLFEDSDVILINSGVLNFDNTVTSGSWKGSDSNYWDKQAQERKTGQLPGYNDKGTDRWEKTETYGTKGTAECIDPNDRTQTSEQSPFNAGCNFISGDVDMVPEGALIIW